MTGAPKVGERGYRRHAPVADRPVATKVRSGRKLGDPSRHESASLHTYLAILRRRAWIIVICTITVPAVAYYLSHRQTPLYAASADVYINQQNLAAALTGINTSGGSSGSGRPLRHPGKPRLRSRRRGAGAGNCEAPRPFASGARSGRQRSPRTPTRTSSISGSPTRRRRRRSFSRPHTRQAFTRYRNQLDSQPIVRAGERSRRRWRASSPMVERARRSTRTSRRRISNCRRCRRCKPAAPWSSARPSPAGRFRPIRGVMLRSA